MWSHARVSDALDVKDLVAKFGLYLTSTCFGEDSIHLDIRTSKRFGGGNTFSPQPGWLEFL
jgi:hypothetical protein